MNLFKLVAVQDSVVPSTYLYPTSRWPFFGKFFKFWRENPKQVVSPLMYTWLYSCKYLSNTWYIVGSSKLGLLKLNCTPETKPSMSSSCQYFHLVFAAFHFVAVGNEEIHLSEAVLYGLSMWLLGRALHGISSQIHFMESLLLLFTYLTCWLDSFQVLRWLHHAHYWFFFSIFEIICYFIYIYI